MSTTCVCARRCASSWANAAQYLFNNDFSQVDIIDWGTIDSVSGTLTADEAKADLVDSTFPAATILAGLKRSGFVSKTT